MKQDLTRLLRTTPFVPFTVKTGDGEVHAVNSVERMSVGNHVCAFIDSEGLEKRNEGQVKHQGSCRA
jgi:hypothetical protein